MPKDRRSPETEVRPSAGPPGMWACAYDRPLDPSPWCQSALVSGGATRLALSRPVVRPRLRMRRDVMKVIVVYESHYGNTAAVAKAIAQGFGPDAQALTTDEAEPTLVAEADLVVAGAPVMAFGLPSDKMLATMPGDEKAPSPPDMSHPSKI